MIGNKVQFKGRSIIVLLLVVFMLALAATPALAWTPVDEENGQPTQFSRVSNESGELTIHYLQTAQPRYSHAVAEKPLLRPNIARAEIMSIAAPQLAYVSD